jgi:hypothetical protein
MWEKSGHAAKQEHVRSINVKWQKPSRMRGTLLYSPSLENK